MSAISTMRLIIQGNASGLVAASNAGGHALQNLNSQAHAAGAGLQWMGGNSTVAANGMHLFGAAANTAAQQASHFAQSASASLRSVGRASRDAAQLVMNKYTALAGGVGAGFALTRSGALDRTLLRIKRTAGATKVQADQLRKDLEKMATDTGTPVEDLVGSFSTMIQSGQSWDSARGAVGAINKAVALTGANADDLARSLAVAGETFNFDLSQPGKALELLDKMMIAGDLGSAEIEDLSDVFAKVGANAKTANFTMEQTLALTEALSKVEKNKERLGTLTDSTLRMFTNQKYMMDAAKATGVKFYEKNGDRRDPVKVLNDLSAAYKKLRTEKERDRFIYKAWGQTDTETMKGIRTMLNGSSLTDLQQYVDKIQKASGSIDKGMGEGMANAASQAERLKETMKKIADEAARPINELFTKYGKVLADNQELLRNIAIGVGAVVAAAAAITLAAKAIETWRTISSVFGGGGGGSGGVGLPGGFGGLGSSPANPMYVVVVGGGANPGGMPTSLPSTAAGGGMWGRVLGWGRSAGQLAMRGLRFGNSMVGGTLIGGALAAYDEGGLTARLGARMVGQTIGAAMLSKIPYVGGIAGRYMGDEAAQALFDGVKDAPEKERQAVEKAANKEWAILDAKSRYPDVGTEYMGYTRGRGLASDRLAAPQPVASPINLTIVNNVDESGRIDTRIEPGVGSPSLLNPGNVLRPQWVLPR